MDELIACLRELSVAAETIWSRYVERGPGNLAADDFTSFAASVEAIEAELERLPDSWPSADWRAEFDTVKAELNDLLRRCVYRSEGLCFVTGEAGLIPRRDLTVRCETALQSLRGLVEALATAEE